MKTAVIYNSQTGFTKRYAKWISDEIGADCFEFAAAKKKRHVQEASASSNGLKKE